MKLKVFAILFILAASASCKYTEPISSSPRQFARAMMAAPMPEPAPSAAAMFAESSDAAIAPNQVLLRTARLVVEVRHARKSEEKVRGMIVKLGGFVADSSALEDDAGSKSISMQLKVPADRLDDAVKALKGVGHVREENIGSEDVTESYIDLNSRLGNSKRLETRLLELLGTKSNKLKDVLDVEKELARVRQDIESMEAKKRFIDNRASLSTIDLTLVEPPGFGRGIFDPLAGVLQRSLRGFTTSFALLVVVVSAAVPWIALLLILGWLGLKALRYVVHKKREAKQKSRDSGHGTRDSKIEKP